MRVLVWLPAFVLCAMGLAGTAAATGDAQRNAQKAGERCRATLGGHILNCRTPSGHHAYHREFTCPIGGEKFRSVVLGTHSRYGRYLDWKPVSYMDLSTPIPVCPSNGFVMFKGEFSDEELDRYRKVIEGKEYRRLFQERHASYYLLARLLELAGEENKDRWWQMLNAIWEADGCKSEKYAAYADDVIKSGKIRMRSLEKSDAEYWVLNIIIPNLYRRTGRFGEARNWLNGVDLKEMAELEGREYFELAFSLLQKAVSEKNSGRVEIRKPQEPEQKDDE